MNKIYSILASTSVLMTGAMSLIPDVAQATSIWPSSTTLEPPDLGTVTTLLPEDYIDSGVFEVNTLEVEGFRTIDARPNLRSLSSSGSSSIGGAFNIQLFNGSGLTPSQQAVFLGAENTWETLIPNYRSGINLPTGSLFIEAVGVDIDGPGGILGQAGPLEGYLLTDSYGNDFLLPSLGIMQFDTADLEALESANLLDKVIEHEMAHVMGFGSLWSASAATGGAFTTAQEVYVDGTGEYTGTHALNAFRNEFTGTNPLTGDVAGLGAPYVPVELDGGPGTANGHWNENVVDTDGDGIVDSQFLTGITSNTTGQDISFELMTGWINTSQPLFISNTSVQSFGDIGYAPVPEPLTILGSGVALGFGSYFKKKVLSKKSKQKKG